MAEENPRIMLEGQDHTLARKCWKQLFEEEVSVGLNLYKGYDQATLYIKHRRSGSHQSYRRNTDETSHSELDKGMIDLT